jgi:hypothetical protein
MKSWVTVKDGTAFPVNISDGEIVHDLKEKIKQKKQNDLQDIDADRLDVYESKAHFDAVPRQQAPFCA